ncbi:MAG: hypothetical protein ACI8RD_001069 [Bacillariaceae sp.]|jgi:hypothetical protein
MTFGFLRHFTCCINLLSFMLCIDTLNILSTEYPHSNDDKNKRKRRRYQDILDTKTRPLEEKYRFEFLGSFPSSQ